MIVIRARIAVYTVDREKRGEINVSDTVLREVERGGRDLR